MEPRDAHLANSVGIKIFEATGSVQKFNPVGYHLLGFDTM
jgi:hypothetical protein